MHVIYNDRSILSKYSENARSVYINIFRTGNVLNYHIVHFLDTNTFLIHNRKCDRGVACNSNAAFCASHEGRRKNRRPVTVHCSGSDPTFTTSHLFSRDFNFPFSKVIKFRESSTQVIVL